MLVANSPAGISAIVMSEIRSKQATANIWNGMTSYITVNVRRLKRLKDLSRQSDIVVILYRTDMIVSAMVGYQSEPNCLTQVLTFPLVERKLRERSSLVDGIHSIFFKEAIVNHSFFLGVSWCHYQEEDGSAATWPTHPIH